MTFLPPNSRKTTFKFLKISTKILKNPSKIALFRDYSAEDWAHEYQRYVIKCIENNEEIKSLFKFYKSLNINTVLNVPYIHHILHREKWRPAYMGVECFWLPFPLEDKFRWAVLIAKTRAKL